MGELRPGDGTTGGPRADGPGGAGFSPEQQAYLEGLLRSLDLHAVFSSGGAAGDGSAAAEVTVHGTPFEDLCSQEQLKAEKHPWEYYGVIRDHAARGAMTSGGDTFMVKHHGLFNVEPAQPGFMCRLRIPACKLRGDQLERVGDIAGSLAGGYAHVTTRGNLQVREVRPERMVDLLNALYDAGLTSKGSGADSVRNITCSPTAGLDPDEVLDLSPHAIGLHHLILNSRDLHGIPRKFNIAFDCGGRLSCVGDTNDVAYVACRGRAAGDDEPRVYCRVLLGGITGHGDFAEETGVALLPEQTPEASAAMLRVFCRLGDRTNRKKARLKYVLDKIGAAEFLRLSEEEAGFGFAALDPAACEPRVAIDRAGHIGVRPQKQRGLNSIGVALAMGRLSVEQLHGVGAIAGELGGNDVRLTVWQNLILAGVPDASVGEAVDRLGGLGLPTSASSFAAGAVACTGKFACQYASAHTKEHGLALVRRLEERYTLESPINIHLTGCPHSCAQHVIGDIGLLGAQLADGREGYHVFLGGGTDEGKGLAYRLCGPVAAEDLAPLTEAVIDAYLADRASGETFLGFTRRVGEDGLRARLSLSGTTA